MSVSLWKMLTTPQRTLKWLSIGCRLHWSITVGFLHVQVQSSIDSATNKQCKIEFKPLAETILEMNVI